MSQNRFNEYSDGDASVSNGSLDLYGFSLRAANLEGGKAIKTTSIGQLYSTDLEISDVSGLQTELNNTLQNPFAGNLITDGVEVTPGNTLKTDTIEPNTALGPISVLADLDVAAGKTLKIDAIEATALGPITLTSNLAMNGKQVSGVSNLESSTVTAQGVASQFLSSNAIFDPTRITCTTILDMDAHAIQEATDVYCTDVHTDNIRANNTGEILLKDDVNGEQQNSIYNLVELGAAQLASDLPGNDIQVVETLNMTSKNIVSLNSLSVDSISSSTGGSVTVLSNLNVPSINSLTPVGGLYAGISDGTVVTQALSPASLLPVSSVGGLSVPANGFSVGDSFHLVCAGIFPTESKNDSVNVELCAVLADTSVVVLGSVTLALENFDTIASNFELEADFSVRSIGLTGQIAVSFDFTFNKKVTSDFKGTRSTNLATIDTTQASTLELNASIVGANGSSIKSTLAYLRKQF